MAPFVCPQGDREEFRSLVQRRSCGDTGVEIVDVERGALAIGCLAHHLLHESQCVGEAGGEGVLERERRRFTLPGLGEVGGKKALGDDWVNLAIVGGGEGRGGARSR